MFPPLSSLHFLSSRGQTPPQTSGPDSLLGVSALPGIFIAAAHLQTQQILDDSGSGAPSQSDPRYLSGDQMRSLFKAPS